MYNSRLILSLFIFIVIISSCTGRSISKYNLPPKECIALNDNGFTHIQDYLERHSDKQLDMAANLLKEAIKCDSTYFIAYKNLADVYGYMKNYNAEISIYDKLIILSNESPLMVYGKASLYLKLNKPDSAKITYVSAESVYNTKLKKDPGNVNMIISKIILKAFSDSKEEAMKELREQIKMHPNDSILIIKKTKFIKDL